MNVWNPWDADSVTNGLDAYRGGHFIGYQAPYVEFTLGERVVGGPGPFVPPTKWGSATEAWDRGIWDGHLGRRDDRERVGRVLSADASRSEVGLTDDAEWLRLANLYATEDEALTVVRLGQEVVRVVLVVPTWLANVRLVSRAGRAASVKDVGGANR